MAERQDQRVVFAHDVIDTLRPREFGLGLRVPGYVQVGHPSVPNGFPNEERMFRDIVGAPGPTETPAQG
jgi:hypothetical protein